jgi:hypothetical protein
MIKVGRPSRVTSHVRRGGPLDVRVTNKTGKALEFYPLHAVVSPHIASICPISTRQRLCLKWRHLATAPRRSWSPLSTTNSQTQNHSICSTLTSIDVTSGGLLVPCSLFSPLFSSNTSSVRRKCLPFQGEHRICMVLKQDDDDDSFVQPGGTAASEMAIIRMRCRMLTRSHPHTRLPTSVANCLGTACCRADVAVETQSRRFEQTCSTPRQHICLATASAAGTADSWCIVRYYHVEHRGSTLWFTFFRSIPPLLAFGGGSSTSHTFLSALKQFTTQYLLVVIIHIFQSRSLQRYLFCCTCSRVACQ